MSEATSPISHYPQWEDLYDEVDPVPLVVELMRAGDAPGAGSDLCGHEASLARLIRAVRERYVIEYWDWLCRSTDEGSDWRPYKSERRNWRAGEEASFDYSAYGGPPDPWRKFFNNHFGKRISATGNRARNPGRFRMENRGPPLAKPALGSVYHQVNRWWRKNIGPSFRPDFDGIASADTDLNRLPHLNEAARLFFLVAQAVDDRVTLEHCVRIDDEEARRQNTAK